MAGGKAGTTDKDGCQCSKRSALSSSLIVGYLEFAITPETSDNEKVYTNYARLGRCSKFDIAEIKWYQCEREDERSYGGSHEDEGHSLSSTLVYSVSLTDVSE